MKLANQVAVVTGAGRGIGQAIALRCADEGAKVALVSRTAKQLHQTADEIQQAGGVASVFPCDVSDQQAVTEMVQRVEEVLGAPNLLVNNAYRWHAIGPLWEVDPAEWCADIAVDLQGVFFCCHAVLPGMVQRQRGRVINLIGGGMDRPLPFGSSYAASKAGVMRLTECLAAETKETGIKVFALDPGLVRTPGLQTILTSETGMRWLPQTQELIEMDIDGPPTLAAHLVVELASGRFDMLSGRALFVADDTMEIEKRAEEILANDLYSLRMKRLDGFELNPILYLGGDLPGGPRVAR